MTALAVGTTQKITPSTIFRRLAEKDRTAVADCVDAYGNFIWALSRKFTGSAEEAEAAALEIFTDIWRYSERVDENQSDENVLVSAIARRRLLTHIQ